MAEPRPGLAIAELTHRFDVLTVVEDVVLSIAPGELVCLVGPSGCGKTTLLRLVAGLEEVQQGAIAIDGATVGAPGRHLPPELRGIGMMFQDYAL
ncbi:MAG TPA: ATP-binding cassette domain-containing protein, partial [Alphaproteobacteria bacterium]|nr:ATP-binding cassette domain-containing protein [Alphaproteobacteria bacterium]